MMTQQDALKLLEISAKLAVETTRARATSEDGVMTEAELKNRFLACVDMVAEKLAALPVSEPEPKPSESGHQGLNEKFATIGEMHRIFAEKFAEYDRKLASLPYPRATSRRP